MPNVLPKPPAIQVKNKERLEEQVQRIIDLVVRADAALTPIRTAVQEGRELLKAKQERTNKPYPDATEAHVPRSRSTYDQLSARITQTITGADVVVHVEADSEEDRVDAECVERMLQKQAETQLRFRDVLHPWVQTSLRDKVSILHVGWKTDERQQMRWEQQREYDPFGNGNWKTYDDHAASGTVEYLAANGVDFVPWEGDIPEDLPGVRDIWDPKRQTVTRYDGPDLRVIPVDRFGWWPVTGGDIQDCTLVYYHVNESGDTIQQRVKAGDYDAAFLKALKDWPGETEERKTASDEKEEIEEEPGYEPTFHGRPFDLIEAYMLYSDEDDGEAQDYLFTIHMPTKAAARAQVNPWWDGERHLVPMRPLPDPEGLSGSSVPEQSAPSQEIETRLARAACDSAEKEVNPPIFQEADALDPTDDAKLDEGLAPGQRFRVQGKPQEMFTPWKVGLNSAAVLPVMQMMQRWGDRLLSVSDTRAGVDSGGRKTAFEIRSTLAEGDVMLAYMVNNETPSVSKAFEYVQAMDYQMLGRKSIQNLWMLANPGTTMEDAVRALGKRYTITAAGSTDSANIELRQQRTFEMAQLLLNCPYLRQWQFYRLLVNNSRVVPDPATLIGTEADAKKIDDQQAQMQQMALQMQMAQAQGQQQPGEDPQVAAQDAQNRQAQAMLQQAQGQQQMEHKEASAQFDNADRALAIQQAMQKMSQDAEMHQARLKQTARAK